MYIKREDALKELRLDHKDVIYIDKNECARRIKAIPSADRPSGEWMPKNSHTMYCDVCGFEEVEWRTQDYGYCPNCGARMKGTEDEH